MGSHLALSLVRDFTSVSGGEVWARFRSNRLIAFVSLSTTSLIVVSVGCPFQFNLVLPRSYMVHRFRLGSVRLLSEVELWLMAFVWLSFL